MFVLILFDFAVLHQRLYNIKLIACGFLYIIFAVLLKFKRSLNSYFVHNNNYYYYYLQHLVFCYLFNIMTSLYVGPQI